MIFEFKYKKVESKLIKHKVQVMEGDIVKIPNNEKNFKIDIIHNSDMSLYFGSCYIISDDGVDVYESMHISNLTFVTREFEDPDHF
jgi:hypothetical protein